MRLSIQLQSLKDAKPMSLLYRCKYIYSFHKRHNKMHFVVVNNGVMMYFSFLHSLDYYYCIIAIFYHHSTDIEKYSG